jgi:hypothetical protein
MNPHDPHEQNTVPEQYPQFPLNPDQDPQDWSQFLQNWSYSSPQLSSPQYDGWYDSASGTPYGPSDSPLPLSSYSLLLQLQPQRPRGILWQWYLGHSNKQRFVIRCGVLGSLLLLCAISTAIANAGSSQQQPRMITAQATQMVTDQVPAQTAIALLIPNPTLIQPPPPSPTPTFAPNPTLTPQSVEKVNVTATSQLVKKVGMQYRYIFDIVNNDNKSFGGSAIISFYNDSQRTPLGQQTFTMTQPLQSGLGSAVYFDIPTAPISQQSGSGITHFKYTILVNGQEANAGGGQITNQYEDTSLF